MRQWRCRVVRVRQQTSEVSPEQGGLQRPGRAAARVGVLRRVQQPVRLARVRDFDGVEVDSQILRRCGSLDVSEHLAYLRLGQPLGLRQVLRLRPVVRLRQRRVELETTTSDSASGRPRM